MTDDAARIGAEVLAARANGETWKALVARYGLDRTTLWRYSLVARSEAVATSFPGVATPKP